MSAAVKEKNGVPYEKINSILDKYLGAVPDSFEYKCARHIPHKASEICLV